MYKVFQEVIKPSYNEVNKYVDPNNPTGLSRKRFWRSIIKSMAGT